MGARSDGTIGDPTLDPCPAEERLHWHGNVPSVVCVRLAFRHGGA